MTPAYTAAPTALLTDRRMRSVVPLTTRAASPKLVPPAAAQVAPASLLTNTPAFAIAVYRRVGVVGSPWMSNASPSGRPTTPERRTNVAPLSVLRQMPLSNDASADPPARVDTTMTLPRI